VQPVTKLLDTPLKLIGAVTAVISLILGANQVMKVAGETRERRRHVAELQRVASEQQKSGDYAAAWASLDEASKITADDERPAVRTAQEDLAMAWLRNVSIPGGSKFSDVVDPLAAVITRGSISATGVRKADLLGHLGWAYFLKSRDGSSAGNPEEAYREAIAIDPMNPFAQAHWGHWIVWRREAVADAIPHFSAAVASGRERAYVRRIQLAAFRLYGSADVDAALIRAVDEMRRNNEPIDASTRRDVFSIYYSAFNSEEQLRRVLGTLPPADHIATIRALFYGPDFDTARAPLRDATVALLQEASGLRDESLATWRAVRAALPRGGDQRVADRADAAIARLTGQKSNNGRR
jgi:tetratricopeptide (TPR) repeat protein